MATPPTVLCPVDFSEFSSAALRYAAAVAAHFRAELAVLTVEDPLLTEARDLGMGIVHAAEDTCRQLIDFTAEALDHSDRAGLTIAYDVAVGRPAPEILRQAADRRADLIVMSTHGLTGVRKLFFGSTTERVLRSTTVPVLVTPAGDNGPARIEDVAGRIGRVLVPVDLHGDASRQLRVSSGIAAALGVPSLLVHAIEPLRVPFYARRAMSTVESTLQARAEDRLGQLAALLPGERCETAVVFGEPAEQITKLARERSAGLIVMGLHAGPLFGPRMGTVTYRTLCLRPALVLAIPPVSPEVASARHHESSAILRAEESPTPGASHHIHGVLLPA